MINPNVEQLESLISAVVNNLYKEVPPTEDEFLEKATLLRNTNAPSAAYCILNHGAQRAYTDHSLIASLAAAKKGAAALSEDGRIL